MPGVYDSGEQQIINWIVDLLKSEEDLQDISFYNLPPMESQSFNPPFAHVFTVSTEVERHGFQDLFQYTSSILLMIGDKISDQTGEERKVYFYKEKVEDLLVANHQPTSAGSDVTLPTSVTIQTMDLQRVVYTPPGEHLAWDFVEMDIDVGYLRVIS